MKILYCVAGMWSCGIIEDEIIRRNGTYLEAKRAFSLEPDQSGITTSRNQLSLKLVVYSGIMINCNFISDLSDQSAFYKTIKEFIDKEAKP